MDKAKSKAKTISCKTKVFGFFIGCSWTGKIEDCIREFYSRSNGSRFNRLTGYVYKCPECGRVILEE